MHTPLDDYPMPPCAKLLGWRLLEHDADAGTARVSFEATADFLNPAGVVQGGILAAMLDDTMGPTVLLASRGAFYSPTIDMHVSFLAPAKAGTIVGEGRVVQLGKSIGFVEATLRDGGGTALARASASVRLVPAARLAA